LNFKIYSANPILFLKTYRKLQPQLFREINIDYCYLVILYSAFNCNIFKHKSSLIATSALHFVLDNKEYDQKIEELTGYKLKDIKKCENDLIDSLKFVELNSS
jgi:hypothetical protein